MKNIIVGFIFCLISLNVYAERVDFGTFENWESYFLTYNYGPTDNGSLCAVKGNFILNRKPSKVIFAHYSNGLNKMLIETLNPNWKLSPNKWTMVKVVIKNPYETLYIGNVRAENNSNYVIKQIPFIVDLDLFKAAVLGSTLEIYFVNSSGMTDGSGYYFDINNLGMVEAFRALARNCPF